MTHKTWIERLDASWDEAVRNGLHFRYLAPLLLLISGPAFILLAAYPPDQTNGIIQTLIVEWRWLIMGAGVLHIFVLIVIVWRLAHAIARAQCLVSKPEQVHE